MKFNAMPLGELADIRFGVHAKDDPTGAIPVLQVKDILDGVFSGANIIRMQEEGIKERDFLRDGDVLFSGKGRIVALKWNNEMKKAVASNSFFVIRLQTSNLLPGFLAAYMNSSSVKREIGKQTKRSTVMHLSVEEIRNLEIPLPPVSVQQKFARLAELVREEKKSYEEIILKKEKILSELIKQK